METGRTRRTPHSGSSPRAGVSQEISLALLDNNKENNGATYPFPALHTAILYSQQNITTLTSHREMFTCLKIEIRGVMKPNSSPSLYVQSAQYYNPCCLTSLSPTICLPPQGCDLVKQTQKWLRPLLGKMQLNPTDNLIWGRESREAEFRARFPFPALGTHLGPAHSCP